MMNKIKIFKLFLLIAPVFGVVFLLFFLPEKESRFKTLRDFEVYAKLYDENPKLETSDLMNPDFTNFYRSTKLSFFKKILKKIGIADYCTWSIVSFFDFLQKMTELRKKEQQNIRSDVKLILHEGDACFVWGDLHGSFHSLVRCLRKLHEKGVLSEDLVIRSGSYFVFLGDAVSRSPYSLEVLNVLLLLMEKNKDQVFYLLGNHENRGYWENFSMRRQIMERSRGLGSAYEIEILSKKINRFFETLPETLAISHQENSKEKIFCSHFKVDDDLLKDVGVKAVIFGEKYRGLIKETRGLEFMGYDHLAAEWSLFSSPIGVYRDFFNFYCDSFIELSIGRSISTSVLAFYSRDLRNEKDFVEVFYDLVFGSKFRFKKYENAGKTVAQIGSTMALTGVTGSLGRETKAGVETSVLAFNNDSEGRKLIKFSVVDDGYSPRLARSNAKSFFENYGIDTFLVPSGTPTLAFYLDMILNKEIAVLFPYTGGPQFRSAEIKNIIHYRASYVDEVQSAIKFLIKEHGIKKFAFFYQDDSYGRPIVKAAREELKKHGINKWLDLPHGRTQADFTFMIEKKLKRETPEAIGFFSSHFPTQELISQLGTEFFLDRILFGVSFLYSQAFQVFLKDRGIDFLFTSVVPDPLSDLEIVREHRQKMRQRGFQPNTNSLEGYIAAELFVDAVKHLEPPYTKEKIIDYFESLNNYKFKGLTLTFDPEKRDFSQPVWLRTFDNQWIKNDRK